MYLTPLFSASCVPFVVVFVLGCGVKGFYLGFFLFSFHTRGGGEADSRPVPLRQIKHCHHPFLPQSSTLSITLTAGPSLPRQVTPLWYAAHVVPFPTSTACIPTAYVGYNNIGLIFIAFFSFFFSFLQRLCMESIDLPSKIPHELKCSPPDHRQTQRPCRSLRAKLVIKIAYEKRLNQNALKQSRRTAITSLGLFSFHVTR